MLFPKFYEKVEETDQILFLLCDSWWHLKDSEEFFSAGART